MNLTRLDQSAKRLVAFNEAVKRAMMPYANISTAKDVDDKRAMIRASIDVALLSLIHTGTIISIPGYDIQYGHGKVQVLFDDKAVFEMMAGF